MLIHNNMYNVFILHQRQTSADKQTNLLAQGVACVLLRQFQLNIRSTCDFQNLFKLDPC
jgi:hypothetical protein